MKHLWDQLVIAFNASILWLVQSANVDVILSRISIVITIILGFTTVFIRLYNFFKRGKDDEKYN